MGRLVISLGRGQGSLVPTVSTIEMSGQLRAQELTTVHQLLTNFLADLGESKDMGSQLGHLNCVYFCLLVFHFLVSAVLGGPILLAYL